MAFNFQEYNAQYLENVAVTGQALNDALEKYGVRIEHADVPIGTFYWQIIGVHHLLPLENWGNHHLYLDVLDEEGKRVRNPNAWVGWTWEGRNPTEPAFPVPVDKPDYEPGGNISITKDQVISAWVNGLHANDNAPSDKVVDIRTTHPDEPLPDGSLFNSWGHHSFYVVFQWRKKTAQGQLDKSVIFGQVNNGLGETVQLLQNNTVLREQVLENRLDYRFANLPAGIYTVKIKGTDVQRGGIEVNGITQVEVNLNMPNPQKSVIYGVVNNGLGYTIVLGKGNIIIARQTIPPDESFRFENLAAGVYNLSLYGTNILVNDIEVDGSNQRVINLSVDQPEPGDKEFEQYVIFGPPTSRGRRTNLFVAMNFLLYFGLSSGFSVSVAKLAKKVSVIGEDFPADQLEEIRQSGSDVEVLPNDSFQLENILNARIQSGKPFGS